MGRIMHLPYAEQFDVEGVTPRAVCNALATMSLLPEDAHMIGPIIVNAPLASDGRVVITCGAEENQIVLIFWDDEDTYSYYHNTSNEGEHNIPVPHSLQELCPAWFGGDKSAISP